MYLKFSYVNGRDGSAEGFHCGGHITLKHSRASNSVAYTGNACSLVLLDSTVRRRDRKETKLQRQAEARS